MNQEMLDKAKAARELIGELAKSRGLDPNNAHVFVEFAARSFANHTTPAVLQWSVSADLQDGAGFERCESETFEISLRMCVDRISLRPARCKMCGGRTNNLCEHFHEPTKEKA